LSSKFRSMVSIAFGEEPVVLVVVFNLRNTSLRVERPILKYSPFDHAHQFHRVLGTAFWLLPQSPTTASPANDKAATMCNEASR
jgi:hypothetical protein